MKRNQLIFNSKFLLPSIFLIGLVFLNAKRTFAGGFTGVGTGESVRLTRSDVQNWILFDFLHYEDKEFFSPKILDANSIGFGEFVFEKFYLGLGDSEFDLDGKSRNFKISGPVESFETDYIAFLLSQARRSKKSPPSPSPQMKILSKKNPKVQIVENIEQFGSTGAVLLARKILELWRRTYPDLTGKNLASEYVHFNAVQALADARVLDAVARSALGAGDAVFFRIHRQNLFVQKCDALAMDFRDFKTEVSEKKIAAYYDFGFGNYVTVIHQATFNSMGLLSQAGVFLHELLRALQVQTMFSIFDADCDNAATFNDEILQFMTATFMFCIESPEINREFLPFWSSNEEFLAEGLSRWDEVKKNVKILCQPRFSSSAGSP